MKVYTYSEARQRLAEVLNIARNEEVIIKRRGGDTFSIIFMQDSGDNRLDIRRITMILGLKTPISGRFIN